MQTLCPSCGSLSPSEGQTFCAECGSSLVSVPKKGGRGNKILTFVLALALGAGLVFASFSFFKPGEVTDQPTFEALADAMPVPLNPDVETGTLGNGLTYYAQSNDSPGNNFEVRLVIKAGSLAQAVQDSGIAHFVEHMVFQGTESFPDGSLMQTLEQLGLDTSGGDINAYTSCDLTVYKFRATSVEDLDVVLQVLDSIATTAQFPREKVITERGVIVEEERLRNTADGMLGQSFNDMYRAGTSYEECDTIGSKDKIITTFASDLQSFYDTWYRPGLMAVIVVGDLAAEDLVDKITDNFSDNPAIEGPQEMMGSIGASPVQQQIETFSHEEAGEPFVSIDFALPARETGTVGAFHTDLMEDLIATLVQDHLEYQGAAGIVDFHEPWGGSWWEDLNLKLFGFGFHSESQATDLTAFMTEIYFLEESGFSAEAVNNAIGDYQSAIDQHLASSGSTQDAMYVNFYVDHFANGRSAPSPEKNHALTTDFLNNLTAKDVNDYFKWLMDQTAPLILVSHNEGDALPSEAAIASALFEAETADLANHQVAERSFIENLMDPPAPVDPIDINTYPDLGISEFVFANGATVVYQFSDISAGGIDIEVASLGGYSNLEPGVSALVDYATYVVDHSGVGPHGALEIEDYIERSGIELTSYIADTSEGFYGSSRTNSLEDFMALLHLRITEPHSDERAFEKSLDYLAEELIDAQNDSYTLAWAEMVDALYGGNDHFRVTPTPEQVSSFTPDAALEIYKSRFTGTNGMVVAIVGDSSYDDVLEMAKRYIGTLPSGSPKNWVDRTPPPPTGVIERFVGSGVNDAAAGFSMLYTTEVTETEQWRAGATFVQEILENRLTEVIREDLGLSYGGGRVSVWYSEFPEPRISFYVGVDTNSDDIALVHSITVDLIDDLRENGPTYDEFMVAGESLLSELDFVSNQTFIERLVSRVLSGGNDTATLDDRSLNIYNMFPAEVAPVVAQLLPKDNRIEVFRSN